MRVLLADALNHAQHRGLVVRNVAMLSVMPKCKEKVERKPFDSARGRPAFRRGHRTRA
jgi:hypothetical protein